MNSIIPELDEHEEKWWQDKIKQERVTLIGTPMQHVEEVLLKNAIKREDLEKDIEKYLVLTREAVWNRYLTDEVNFHSKILADLTKLRKLPQKILDELLASHLLTKDLNRVTREELFDSLSQISGSYVGRIMPYIYTLCLSTTQSRRARAGKVFETIVESFFKTLGYSCNNQGQIGTDNHTRLGKKVDLVVPNVLSYTENRSKCAIVTMKTTLRERWQEVAEELARTNVPHIYLLTIDGGLSVNTIDIMKQHNITLVLFLEQKIQKFADKKSVIDYNTFFFREIPHILKYWE